MIHRGVRACRRGTGSASVAFIASGFELASQRIGRGIDVRRSTDTRQGFYTIHFSHRTGDVSISSGWMALLWLRPKGRNY